MYYILSSSTISHQNTFEKKGFSASISALNNLSELIQPNYKDYIESSMLRRMSGIIRMSICCALDCIKQSAIKEPEAIIVGTGLGCLFDTENFLNNMLTANDNLISPTSFIQSTHNTIAGQLSILLKNHNYNMTHTQNSLSFERAIQDGMLCLDEGKGSVLVGAADEHTKILDDISKKLDYTGLHLTSGASFFMISKNKNVNTNVKIAATAAYRGAISINDTITDFFTENEITSDTIDLILYSSIDVSLKKNLHAFFNETLLLDYQKYCGIYFSNSAFAVHLAIDILEQKKVKFEFITDESKNIKRILVCNNLNDANLGLTLIESIET